MNPGSFVLLVSLAVAVAIVAAQLLTNRPKGGWFAWARAAFRSEGNEVDAEPHDLTLADLLDEAEVAPDYPTIQEFVRR